MIPERLKARLQELPEKPGVYLFRDREGKTLYIGKAVSIKKRVAGHFRFFDKGFSKESVMLSKLAADEYSPAQVFSSFASVGIPFREDEFQYYLLSKMGQAKLASDLDVLQYHFTRTAEKLPVFPLSLDHADLGLAKLATPLVKNRSLFHPFLTVRLSDAVLEQNKFACVRLEREPEILRNIAAAYSSYLTKLGELYDDGRTSCSHHLIRVFSELLDDSPLEKTAYRILGESEVARALLAKLVDPHQNLTKLATQIHSRIGSLPLCRTSPEALALLDPDEATHWLIEQLG